MGELIDKTKGKIKQAIGAVTGNEQLEDEGKRDELAGKVEGAIADVKKTVKDAGQTIAHAVKK